MPWAVSSIEQGSGNARPRHRVNRPSLSGGQIAQATGLARATVKRLIQGDRRHKAKLAGLGWVRWDDGIKNRTPALGARANPYERSDALCRFHSPVVV
jgi:hypothetical protein